MCWALGCPVGTFDNSPAIYRWVPGPGSGPSPVGTAEAFDRKHVRRLRFSRPYGTHCFSGTRYPSSELLGYFHQAPTGLAFTQGMSAKHIRLSNPPADVHSFAVSLYVTDIVFRAIIQSAMPRLGPAGWRATPGRSRRTIRRLWKRKWPRRPSSRRSPSPSRGSK